MTEQKYHEHFLMDTETVKQYVKDQINYFDADADLEATEIGDGNINYVFRVVDKNSGKSLVVKQADKYLRCNGRPLDLHRNKIEAEILKEEGKLAPGFVPEIYGYNEVMCALTMEDISAYKNMRTEMLKGKTFEKFAEDITDFMVDTLLPTTDLVMDRHVKKEKVQLFTNVELCDITENLVFTEPYWNFKNGNIITEGEEAFVEETLYNNEHLKAEVGKLRNNFMNNAQALIHGDLHSGSIFINNDGLKVIDPEFAFYGPMGYDSGNVIGNLCFAWANKICTEPDNAEFLNWIEQAVVDVYDLFKAKLEAKYDELVTFPLYANAEFKKYYIDGIMADTMGCAGTEMIRRTVGDSKVAEVSTVKDHDTRVRLDKMLVLAGAAFITGRESFTCGKEVAEIFRSFR